MFIATPSGSERYSWKPPDGSVEWKNAPPMPASDFAATSAVEPDADETSLSVPATYAFPRESHVTVGSTQASAVWSSSSVNCQNGGVWSPH